MISSTKLLTLFIITFLLTQINAQEDDLEALLTEEMGDIEEKTLGTFLSTYVLNNPSVELIDKNGLNLHISHKFGFLNSGPESFYGFDHSNVFMGVDFAPLDWINVGVGRNTRPESINGQLRVRITQQTSGKKTIPLSIVAYGELDYSTKEYTNEELDSYRKGRFEYTSQLLIARKISHSLSLQVMPTLVHRNLVDTKDDLNQIKALGFGGTFRLLNRLRLNAEYFWVQEHNTKTGEYFSPLSLGICYQTSRHAFELFASNSDNITSNNHIANTTGNFWEGDICIGFNVSIIFSVKR